MPLSDGLNRRVRTLGRQSQKIAVRNLIDIYRDRWSYILEEELAKQFSAKEFSRLYLLRTLELNLLKRVVNELSLIYKESATRVLESSEDEKEVPPAVAAKLLEQNKLYEEITGGYKKDTVLKQVNRYTNLCNHTVLKVGYEKGKLTYDILLFDNVEVYTSPGDWKKIAAVKYYQGLQLPIDYSSTMTTKDPAKLEDKRTSNKWQIYSSDVQQYSQAVVWVAEDISAEGILENDGVKTLQSGKVYFLNCTEKAEHISRVEDNPYKDDDGEIVMPFVFFDKSYPVDHRFDFTQGNDLRDLTVSAAIALVHLNQLMKYQSYKTVVLSVQDKSKIGAGIETGPASAIILENGIEGGTASASVLNLESNLNQLLDFVKQRIFMVLAGYGVSPENFSMSGQAQSGLSLKISNMGKLEAREDQLDIYRMCEEELFKVEKVVYNTLAEQEGRELIMSDLDFRVDFGEISFPRDLAETAAWMTFLKSNNAISALDIIKYENPDLDDDESMAVYLKNKSLNTGTLMPIQQPGQAGAVVG